MEKLFKSSVEKATPLPEYISMYEISGQDSISEYGIARYQRDKINNDKKIKDFITKEEAKPLNQRIREGLSNSSLEIRKESAYMIKSIPEEERTLLIREMLDRVDIEVQKILISIIKYVPEKEAVSLIREGLNCPDLEVNKASAEMVEYVSEDDITSLAKEFLNHQNPQVKKIAAGMIWNLSKTEREPLQKIILYIIKDGLKNPDIEVQKISTEMIRFASQEERGILIREALGNADIEVQKIAAEMINCASEAERTSLQMTVFNILKENLFNSNLEIQKALAEMIKFVPEKETVLFITEILEHADIEVQKIAVKRIYYLSKTEREPLQKLILQTIKDGLKNPDVEIQKISAEMIEYVSEEDKVSLIREGFYNPNPEVQKVIISIIKFVSEENMAPLIKEGLNCPDFEVNKVSAEMIEYISKKEKDDLFVLAIAKGLGNYLIQTPLYKKGDITNEKFSRTKFAKTGSETILLGGDLKEKTIIREVQPQAFLAWQELYENWKLWQQNGFDYVPIEPIQSFILTETELVRVYGGVLDLSLRIWEDRTDRFVQELYDQKVAIEKVLEDQHIIHGHMHRRNFCLRFFRDEHNQPDFTRCPRLYLIDFDQAVSTGI